MFLRSATKVFSVVCWLQKVHSLIYAWENWTGCLLARAINLQLEVNDKWKKKGFWHIGTELLGLCLGGSRAAAAFLGPWKAGEFLIGDKPGVSFWGLRRSRLCPSAHPENPSPRFPLLSAVCRCCCGFFRAGLLQVLGSRQPLALPVQQGCSVGSEFPLRLFLGALGRMNPLALVLCWVWPQIPCLALSECTETLSEELLLPGLSSCTNFTSSTSNQPWINHVLINTWVREGFPLLNSQGCNSSSVLQLEHFWGFLHYIKNAFPGLPQSLSGVVWALSDSSVSIYTTWA